RRAGKMKALALLLLTGCTATEVAVTVHLPGIEQHQIAADGILSLNVPMDGDYVKSWQITGSSGTERFVYRAGTSSGTLEFHAEWYALGVGVTLACGDAPVML